MDAVLLALGSPDAAEVVGGVGVGALAVGLLALMRWRWVEDARREDKYAEGRSAREARTVDAIERISVVLPGMATGIQKLEARVEGVASDVRDVGAKVDSLRRDVDELTPTPVELSLRKASP